MTAEHYGRGAALPLALAGTGGVRENAGQQRIEQSIRVILGTQYGERVMRPTFGANLRSLAFAGNDPSTANLAQHLVASALARWEPRICDVDADVRSDLERGALVITVRYRVTGTQDARNLVHTFALDQAAS